MTMSLHDREAWLDEQDRIEAEEVERVAIESAPWPEGWDPHLAAKRGAAWLDETRPGWERSIDLVEFDIRSGCRCVLGQVFAKNERHDTGFDWVMSTFGHYGDGWSRENGFDVYFDDDEHVGLHSEAHAALDEAWIDLIRERQA